MSFKMWELSKNQAKELELKYFIPFFEQKGYKLRKSSSSEYDFNKKEKDIKDIIFIGHLEAFPGTRIEFTIIKEIFIIEKIIRDIMQGLGENLPKRVYNATLKFNTNTLKGEFVKFAMPEMLNEADVASSCEIVKNFMTETGFHMLERFNDIKELDKEINGENFCTTDWQMPFDLGGDFDIKRIIVAWLAENKNFDDVVEKTFEIMSQNSDGTYYNYNRNDLSLRLPYTVHYLKNLSKPN